MISTIFAADAPQGRLRTKEEGFPSVYPHHVEDFDPSHHFARIPTAGEAASTTADPAADRDRRGRSGRMGFYGVNLGDTSTGTECPAKGLALG